MAFLNYKSERIYKKNMSLFVRILWRYLKMNFGYKMRKMNITESLTNLKELCYNRVNEKVTEELFYVIALPAAKFTWRWWETNEWTWSFGRMTLAGEDRSMECHLAHRSKHFSPSTSTLKSVKCLSGRVHRLMCEWLNLWIQDGWKDRLIGVLVIACVSDVVVKCIKCSRVRVWIHGWMDTWAYVSIDNNWLSAIKWWKTPVLKHARCCLYSHIHNWITLALFIRQCRCRCVNQQVIE
jgi:hypothetical protein